MAIEYGLLSLIAPVGKGQENRPDDVAALDNGLRQIDAYAPPPEYADGPQRYATEPVIDALERFQEKSGLKTDAIANPGGPTERAINNRLLNKPRGAGLLFEPAPSLVDNVGNGFKNDARDVASVQRSLGALDYLPEDPFDAPPGIITEATTNGMKRFQLDKGLTPDGWMAPGGETERALEDSISDLARERGTDWFDFAKRAGRTRQRPPGQLSAREVDEGVGSSSPQDDELKDEVILTRSPPSVSVPAPGPSPSVPSFRTGPAPYRGPNPNVPFGVNPNYVPPRRDREPPSWPRDLEWANPGPRPSRPNPVRVPAMPDAHDWEPPTPQDIETALKREPMPDPDKLVTYPPQPGSPLAIPIVGSNPNGRSGDPRTQALNRTLGREIEKACKEVMEDAKVVHYSGVGSLEGKEKAIDGSEGRSYPDFETTIGYKGITIRIFGDTYTALVSHDPNARERRQFARLDKSTDNDNRIFVRVPKAWMFGEEINPKKLAEFTRELCREVKKVVDEGKVGDGKEKLRIEKIIKNLTEKKEPAPKTAD